MPKKWTKADRVAAANSISLLLLPNYRPHFILTPNGGLSFQYHTTGTRRHAVRIVDGSYMTSFRSHPWGMNSEQALVYLAIWIRTGKMLLTVDQWERWCGPPVMLGNAEFLAAIKREIYGRD